MSSIKYNVIDNKAYIKEGGKWVQANLERVTSIPSDEAIEKTDADNIQEKFLEASNKLKQVIQDAKEKAELFNLRLETRENLERKIAEYTLAKQEYDKLKKERK